MIGVRMVSLVDDELPRLCRVQFDIFASSSNPKDKLDSSLPHVSTWTTKSFLLFSAEFRYLWDRTQMGAKIDKKEDLRANGVKALRRDILR
jgi:hypothetical protein